MPCWYYDRQEIEEMCNHGIDPKVESRYRKEGPRFILDCGGKMGLRYETCATGVVYFHRFYLFRSFRDFNRHVTAACCLFLAGKVEETPKKCKDIIKVARGMLTDQQFASFGEDPREEVMTMERILLQTIKFDLQVEHPYYYLLKFAKVLKGGDDNNSTSLYQTSNREKEKIQAMVQMAWTFINDSMCTLLCLQWEPDIIAVALMYLASRLKTFDINDWQGKTPNTKGKWWNNLVEDITFELLEDICHQVLDLYSSPQQNREESPPPPPPPPKNPPGGHKRPQANTPSDPPDAHGRERAAPPPAKMIRRDRQEGGRSKSPSPTPNKNDKAKMGRHGPPSHGPGTPVKARPGSNQVSPQTGHPHPPGGPPVGGAGTYPRPDGRQYNPYMPSAMYGSSFMSGEGAQSIQSLMSGGGGGGGGGRPGGQNAHPPVSGPPAPQPSGGHYPPTTGQYSQPGYGQPQQPPYQSYQQQPPPQAAPYQPAPGGPAPPYPPQNYQQPPPQQQPPTQAPPGQPQPAYNYQYPSYGGQPAAQPNAPPYPPPQPGYPNQPNSAKPQPYPGPYAAPQQYPPPPAGGAAPPPGGGQYNYQGQNPPPGGYQQQYAGAPPTQGFPVRGPPPPNQPGGPPKPSTGLPTVRITGRR